MSSIENLLRRRQEGTITDEELIELNLLTHRDQVIEAATQRAKVIRHRRYAGISGVASVLVVVGLFFTIHHNSNGPIADGPLMAQAEAPSTPAVQSDADAPQPKTPTVAAASKDEDTFQLNVQHDVKATKPVMQAAPSSNDMEYVSAVQHYEAVAEEMEPSVSYEGETVVACNTQCSPDSVINDIWNFLKA